MMFFITVNNRLLLFQNEQIASIQRSFSVASANDTTEDTHVHSIMKRIPKGAEATTVLVGSLEFLSRPIMAFVRLSEGRLLGNLTEVPLPVRFVFILMGPQSANLDYHEIGRSISTLMSNTVRFVVCHIVSLLRNIYY